MKPVPIWRRFDRLFGADVASDVRDELRFHIEAKTEDLIAQGWKPDAVPPVNRSRRNSVPQPQSHRGFDIV